MSNDEAVVAADSSNNALHWPLECPACGYSWQGLPAPRCPECGEHVAADEMVLIGRSRPEMGRHDTWIGGVGVVTLGIGVIALVAWIRHSTDLTLLVVLGVIWALTVGLHTLRWLSLRRRGMPDGVIRISPAGFRMGAGIGVGRLRPWAGVMLQIVQTTGEAVRFRVIRCWQGIPFRGLTDVEMRLTEEQITRIAACARAWGAADVVITSSGLHRIGTLVRRAFGRA